MSADPERVRRAAAPLRGIWASEDTAFRVAAQVLDASGYPADLAEMQRHVDDARADADARRTGLERALDALRALIDAKTDEEYDEQYTAALAVLVDLTAETENA